MEVLQKLMTRRIGEQSYKRNAKHLMVDESTSEDVDSDDRTQISNLNPSYNIINGNTFWATNSSDHSVTSASYLTTTILFTDRAPQNSAHHTEPTFATADFAASCSSVHDDPGQDDNLLQKFPAAVRRRLTLPKAFVGGQRTAYRIGAVDDETNSKVARNDTGKEVRLKPIRKMIDLVDICTIGRKHRNERRKLLSEECDDE